MQHQSAQTFDESYVRRDLLNAIIIECNVLHVNLPLLTNELNGTVYNLALVFNLALMASVLFEFEKKRNWKLHNLVVSR